MTKPPLPLLTVIIVLVCAPALEAGQFSFSFNGGGVTSAGTIFTDGPGPSTGSVEITNVTGTFQDTNVGINGIITGIYTPVSYSITHGSIATAFNDPNSISYDDLFYPAGDSPNVCGVGYPYTGGVFDVFGVLFNVSGGYVAALWSNGDVNGGPILYAAGDANQLGILNNPGPTNGVIGTFSVSSVPEPGFAGLTGAALAGLALMLARKLHCSHRGDGKSA